MPNFAPFEIIASPADVWIAAAGTAFPTVDATPAAGWISLGYTDGGISVSHSQSIESLMVDQLATPVKTIRTEEGLTIDFSLAQLTLERYALAINNATVTTTAATVGPPATVATKSIQLQRGVTVATHSMLIRGPSPYGNFNMQYEVPIVYQAGEPSVSYTRDGMATLETSWVSLADTTKATGQQFGRLVAQTA